MWRAFRSRPICTEREDGHDPYAVDYAQPQRMVAEDVYCIDVLTQISAVTKALHAVGLGLLEDHLAHCVVGAARESDEAAAAKVTEASAAIARLLHS